METDQGQKTAKTYLTSYVDVPNVKNPDYFFVKMLGNKELIGLTYWHCSR